MTAPYPPRTLRTGATYRVTFRRKRVEACYGGHGGWTVGNAYVSASEISDIGPEIQPQVTREVSWVNDPMAGGCTTARD